MSDQERGPSTEQPPWPYLTVNQAAQLLNVPTDLVRGLAGGPRLRGQWTETVKGNRVWLLNREDVEALAKEIKP